MTEEKYSLVGVNGNAFSVMGYVRKAMRKEGFDKKEIQKYTKKAMSGDYNKLLTTSMEILDKVNKKAERNNK